jgi:hypothetical protein
MKGQDYLREVGSFTPSAATAQPHTPPELARDQQILDRFTSALRVCGVVGEDRNAKLIYLALISRRLDEPVSLALKGVSSSGKSYTTETTLRFFPPEAYIEMTAMSERALVYMQNDFAHRMIVLFEAVALREQREKTESNLTAYFVRSLLSEGRIRYPVTVRDKDGSFVTKTIEKNGPTGLILTTTATSLHGENETRLLSLPTNDTAGQTKAVLRQIARGSTPSVDFREWHALQSWLETAETRVVIPYAGYLAESMPPVAVRLRRDFRAVLRLIQSHAILHQLSRQRDDLGRIVASGEDYQVVRGLVADLISDGVGATVSATMRETVECVRGLGETHPDGVTVTAAAAELGLDRSAAQRRLWAARERGYVTNLEDRRGRPARYVTGEPLPDEVVLLPHSCTPAGDETAGQEGVCSCAVTAEGVERNPPDLFPEDDLPLSEPAALALLAQELDAEVGETLPKSAAELVLDGRRRGYDDLAIAALLTSGGYPPPEEGKRWTPYHVRALAEGMA